jgi:hypothetical protein
VKNNRFRIGAVAALATVTTGGWLALAPAAFADPTVTSATTYHAVIHHPDNYLDCTQWLDSQDYPVTPARAAACAIAQLGLPNSAAAIAACNVALLATRVDPGNAFFACTLAAEPN